MRTRRTLRATAVSTAAILALSGASAAGAQTRSTAVGSVEMDSERLAVLVVGASAHSAADGLAPAVGLLAYRLHSPFDGRSTDLTAVNPSAGVRYQAGSLAVDASLGYLFLTADSHGGFGAPRGAGEGVVTSARGEYGASGPTALEAAAAYNWGDRYFWSRGRATRRVLALGGRGSLRLGVEGGGQLGQKVQEPDYRMLQAAPLVELRPTPEIRLIGVLGARNDNLMGRPEFFPYLGFEIALMR